MPLVPHRFLVRLGHPCAYIKKMPLGEDDQIVDLPEIARLKSFNEIDSLKEFADVRIAWNELGIGLQVIVKGKDQYPVGDVARPRQTDGITLWIDTREDRSSHRASRTCHQFHFLAAGGGAEKDEPIFTQTKINRALQDAPLSNPEEVPFRSDRIKGGYRIEAFLSGAVLNGFDPEQYPRLGIFYAVYDHELGEQTLGINSEFPFSEDPSLWSMLELVKS
jgi:hypothetical protein